MAVMENGYANGDHHPPKGEIKKLPPPPPPVVSGVSAGDSIHACAQAGDLDSIRSLLQQAPSLINAHNAVISQTPLHAAAAYNKLEVVKFLLDAKGREKADLEAQNMHGEMPLHVAAKMAILKWSACLLIVALIWK